VQPSYVRTVFFDPDGGLKAGWGFASYVAMFYPLQFVASRSANSLNLGASGLWSMMLEEFGVLVAAVLPALVLARFEKRPWAAYGLPVRAAFGKLFWAGAAWGFASISFLLAAMYGLRVFEVGHLVLHGARIVKFGVFWAVMFLLVGLFEDFLFRGYSQFTLARVIGFWPSAVVLSCLFGLIHWQNGGEQWPGLLAAAAIGFFFCLTLRRTGSLWFAVGFHAAWDFFFFFFFCCLCVCGFLFFFFFFLGCVGGGGGGGGGPPPPPEGSVLCFVVIAVVWVGFEKVYAKSKSLPQRARGITG
jgi:membrane protease YdiL (CAAX protease family)